MLNSHNFIQETVNSITEVIEKSAIQEIKILTNALLEYTKDSVRFFVGLSSFS